MTGVLLVFISAIAWVALDAIRKVIGDRVPALVAAGAIAGAQLPFLLFTILFVDIDLQPFVTVEYWTFAFPTVLWNVLAGYWFVRAVQESPLGLTIPYLSFTPVFVAIIGAFFLDQQPSIWGWAGIVIVVAGAVFLNPAADGAFNPLRALIKERGALFMLGVAAIWSFTPALDKKAVDLSSPLLHSITLSAGVLIGAFIVVAVRHRSAMKFLRDVVPIARSLLWIAGLANVVAIVFQLWAYTYVDVAYVETIKRAIGVLGAMAVGAMFFSERFRLPTYLGAFFMVVGVSVVVLLG